MEYQLINQKIDGYDSNGFPICNGYCYLNETGKKFFLYKKSINRTKFFEWLRYGITTAIAIAAIIISLVS
jgi:hypothetical protein